MIYCVSWFLLNAANAGLDSHAGEVGVQWYVQKSLNEMNFEPEREANKKGKSSACCGLSGVCGDGIVTHWAIHFYRASQLPEAPPIVWQTLWHWTQALTTQLSERILTFYWKTEESWRTHVVLQVHATLAWPLLIVSTFVLLPLKSIMKAGMSKKYKKPPNIYP